MLLLLLLRFPLARVRIIDNFCRITLLSESKDLIGCCFCCEPGGGVTPAREMDELECVRSSESDVRERLNRDKTLYVTGGCAGECMDDDCDAIANAHIPSHLQGQGQMLPLVAGWDEIHAVHETG